MPYRIRRSDELPWWLSQEKFQREPFFITIDNGHKIKVRLGSYDLNSLFGRGSKHLLKGALVLYKSPCPVVPLDTQIRFVKFGILNFKEFYGGKDKWAEVDGKSVRLGNAVMQCDGWQIEIAATTSFQEDLKILRKDGGYAITHTGTFNRFNNEAFSVEKAEHLLRGMRAFFSFSRGVGCGLTSVWGCDENGNEMPIIWGTQHTEPWANGRRSWLTKRDGGDSLSAAFQGFWRLIIDKEWNETIPKTIDWYTSCSTSPVHVGIVLIQAALESLSHKINGKKVTPAAKALGKSLKKLSFDIKVPNCCVDLGAFAHSIKFGDAPHAVTWIRNEFVHPQRKCSTLSIEVQLQALYLSQW